MQLESIENFEGIMIFEWSEDRFEERNLTQLVKEAIASNTTEFMKC